MDPIPPDGILPDGFVQSTDPEPNRTDVPHSLTHIVVTYNQPMSESGAGSVANVGAYSLTNTGTGVQLSFASASYDADDFSVSLELPAGNQEWLPGTCYALRIKQSVRNACDQRQDADVIVEFCTAP